MAKGKQRAWHVLDGLYRDVEDARRHYEHGTSEEGAAAFERWLEIIEIADWSLEERDAGDSTDLEGESTPSSDSHGPDEGREQLQLPGVGELGADVPRGTLQRNSQPVPVVGTVVRVKHTVPARRLVGGES